MSHPNPISPVTARRVGRAQSGRHREHVFPARPHRIAPSFTAEEYAAVLAAAARVGLTPTGFCADAALRMATNHVSEDTLGTEAAAGCPGGERAEVLAVVQAELADLRTAVVRVGTNLNQAVTVLHATGQPPVWLARVVDLCARALVSVDEAASRLHRRLR